MCVYLAYLFKENIPEVNVQAEPERLLKII